MRTKDNPRKHNRILIFSTIFILIILYIVIFYDYHYLKNEVYAKETSSDIDII